MVYINKYYDGYNVGLNMLQDMDDSSRPISEASDCLNVMSRKTTGFESRKGFHWMVPDIGGYGLFNYIKKNDDGSITEELLTVDDNLHRIKKGEFQIDYTGSENVADVQISVSSTAMRIKVNENEVEKLDHNAGQGYDEATVKTLATLKTDIDALTDFSATNTASTTLPSAFLPPQRDIIILKSGNQKIGYYYSEKVNSPFVLTGTEIFQTVLDNRDKTNMANVNAVNHRNVLYMAFNGALMKYDGLNVYKAGLPLINAPTVNNLVGSGNLTGAYLYHVTYIYTDNQSNQVESKISDDLSITVTAENIVLDLPNIVESSGYNTKCAIAVGAQTATPSASKVTLNADDGIGSKHSLDKDDTVFIFNRHSTVDAYKTYVIDSVTISTVVLKTDDTIQVNDNDPISANLRIAIYRTSAGGNTDNKSLVAEIPNNSFSGFQQFTDSIKDVNLGAAFAGQTKTYGPPPTCSFVAVYKQTLVLGQDYTLYYSDQGNVNNSSEVFPSTDNSEEVFTHRGGIIRGLGISGDTLCIFTDKAIVGLEGDLVTDQYSTYKISEHIGCQSHDSITSVGLGLFFLSEDGIYQLVNGRFSNVDKRGIPIPESRIIDPFFKQDKIDSKHDLVFRRAVGINDVANSRFLLFIPAETLSTHTYANNHSRILVFEYNRERWYIWDVVNMASGAVIFECELWFQERNFDQGLNYKLGKVKEDDVPDDYADHVTAITKDYISGWDTLTDNTTYKKPLWFKGYFRRVNHSDNEAAFKPDISIEQDYVDGNKISSATLTLGKVGMQWNDPWGREFGGHLEHEAKFKIRARKSRSIRVRFQNAEISTNFFVSAWEITYALPYERTMKE